MKARTFEMTEEEYSQASQDYVGFCVACGAEKDGCEPDARRYPCDECGAKAVYGAEELLIMGLVRLSGEED